MEIALEHGVNPSPARDYRRALDILPDRCAFDLAELARRIGADKIELITCARGDLELARLLASKMADHNTTTVSAQLRTRTTGNT